MILQRIACLGLVFIGAGFLLAPLPAEAKIYIRITEAGGESFPLALVPPVRDGGAADTAELGREFATALEDALRLMGIFRFIRPEAFLEDPAKKAFEAKNIDFASWAVLDTLAIVKGWYRIEGSRLTLEARLFDVLLRKELVARRYTGTPEEVRKMAHRFANQIMTVLTGEPGLFETRIAYCAGNARVKELHIMDFNGDNPKKLTRHAGVVMSPAWSGDGRSIYYVLIDGIAGSQIYRYDFQDTRSRRLTSYEGIAIGVSVHPARDLIGTALTRDGNSEIYLLTLEGAINRRLTRHPDIDVSPSFSPDGRSIAFTSNRQGNAQIFRMDENGGNVTRLTFRGRNNTSPVWSPRGDKILFAGMDDDGDFDIFSMSSAGIDMVRLTYDTKQNEEPAWSPDGQLIVFTSNRSGEYQIYVMRPDGSRQVTLTSDNLHSTMPAWGPIVE